jgi:histidinol-phosphate aminotransferase
MEKRLVNVARAILDIETPQRDYRIEPSQGMLKLDDNGNSSGPSPKVYEAVNSLMRNWPLEWQTDRDNSRLISAISEYVSLPKASIRCFDNIQRTLEYIGRTYLENGTEVLIDSYPEYPIDRIASATGAETNYVSHVNPFEPSIEGLINCIKPRTRLIYIGNPNGITGGMYSESEIVFLLAYAERAMVVINEEYFEYSGCSVADLTMRFPNLMVIRSFSKAFGLAALGAAYLLSDPENLEFIDRLSDGDDLNGLQVAAALAALDDMAYVKSYADIVEQSKRIISNNLPEIGYEFFVTPANFIVLKVANSELIAENLRAENILVRDLSDSEMDGYLRISIGTLRQTDQLLISLGKLADKAATGYNRNRFSNLSGRQSVERRAIPVMVQRAY